MKLLLTGGHFSPALSLISALKKNTEIAVVGRKTVFEGDSGESLEYRICKQMNIPFYPIRTGRLQRHISFHTIPSLSKLPVGFFDARKIINDFQPDIVVTFGGYLSLPVAYVAWRKNIPIIVHEQTFGAGLANRAVAKIATKVCISFDSSRAFFPAEKTVKTGNPIRSEIFDHTKELHVPSKLPILYITGGSSGSHILNSLVHETISHLVQKYVVMHQTGDSQEFQDYDSLVTVRNSLSETEQKRYILKKFVEPQEIGSIFHAADLVVSRSGINTVTEILALGKPAFFIPLATGQKNEQLTNAQFVKKIGLGTYVLQDEITPDRFTKTIDHMIESLSDYKKCSREATKYAMLDATTRLVDVIRSVYEVQVSRKKTKNKEAGEKSLSTSDTL